MNRREAIRHIVDLAKHLDKIDEELEAEKLLAALGQLISEPEPDPDTGLAPCFNCDPEELEWQQKIIKTMESWANNPFKFLEQYTGIKLRWHQKVWIIISSKFGYKNK